MSFRSVFHFGEFDETISGTGNDFGVVCMWHELCRENVSHVAFWSDTIFKMDWHVPVSSIFRTANLS
jgi:hypothetical protein